MTRRGKKMKRSAEAGGTLMPLTDPAVNTSPQAAPSPLAPPLINPVNSPPQAAAKPSSDPEPSFSVLGPPARLSRELVEELYEELARLSTENRELRQQVEEYEEEIEGYAKALKYMKDKDTAVMERI